MICFCADGLMSTCTADDWDTQRGCYFSERSSVENRCMHRIEAIGNHCDCQKAQDFVRNGLHIDQRPVEEEELDIEDLIEDDDYVVSCKTCVKFDTCHDNPPQHSLPEMEKIAEQCRAYRLQREWEKGKSEDDLPF